MPSKLPAQSSGSSAGSPSPAEPPTSCPPPMPSARDLLARGSDRALRDQFAAHVLAALLEGWSDALSIEHRLGDEDEPGSFTIRGLEPKAKAAVAAEAYEWADALLDAREARDGR